MLELGIQNTKGTKISETNCNLKIGCAHYAVQRETANNYTRKTVYVLCFSLICIICD